MTTFVARSRHLFKGLFLLLLLLAGAAHADSSWPSQSSQFLQQLLQTNPDRLPELDEGPLVEFYQQRKFEPLWSNESGRLDRAYDLLHAVIHARDEGLNPADYYLEEMWQYWESKGLGESVKLDLLLSAALYRYSNDVYSGRYDATDLDPDWHIRNKALDTGKLFEEVARKSSIAGKLKRLPPQHPGYQALKHQLIHFRELAQKGGWKEFGPGP